MTVAEQNLSSSPVLTPTAATALDSDRKHQRAQRRALLRAVRHALLVGAGMVAAAAAVYAFRPRPVPIDLGSVSRGALSVEVRESGITRVKDRYVVSAPVIGELQRVALEANDAVSEGQILAEIAPSTAPLLDGRTQRRPRHGSAQSNRR